MSIDSKILIVAVLTGVPAYLIPLYFDHIWLGYFLLLIIALGYLGVLFRSAKKNLEKRSAKWVVMGFAGLMILSHSLDFLQQYHRGNVQKEYMLEIRKNRDLNIIKADVQQNLTHIFTEYHRDNKDSIIETARELIPEKMGVDGKYWSDYDLNNTDPDTDDKLNYYYEMDETLDVLKVIVVADVALGEIPTFENYDGQNGKFEVAFHVNPEEVAYEIRN